MFNFEKLETWQQAIHFADLVYEVTRGFPAEEQGKMLSGLRRSVLDGA
jgi:hypothetical protein